jgi:hypothetical protein
MVTQLIKVQAVDLRGVLGAARTAGRDWTLYVRNVGGLELNDSGYTEEGQASGYGPIPGVLVEGVSNEEDPDKHGFGVTVRLTVWAGNAMHEIGVDDSMEVEARLAGTAVPEIEECGRCGRSLLPWFTPHVGC